MWTNAAWARTTVLPTQLAPIPMVATSVRVTQAFPGTARHVQILTNASSTSTVVMLTLNAPMITTVLLVHASQATLAMGRRVLKKVFIVYNMPEKCYLVRFAMGLCADSVWSVIVLA